MLQNPQKSVLLSLLSVYALFECSLLNNEYTNVTFSWRFQIYFSLETVSKLLWPEFMATDLEVWVRFPTLPDSLRSTGSATGSTQPREYN
jgi:hypothetical protein